jgi:hypothetical protein
MIRADDSVNAWLIRLGRDVNTVLTTLTPADLPGQPINWNDLSCNEVMLQWDGVRLVAVATIEEAAPRAAWMGCGWVVVDAEGAEGCECR